MIGILLSFWDGLFSGAMLVSGSVHHLFVGREGFSMKHRMFFEKKFVPMTLVESAWEGSFEHFFLGIFIVNHFFLKFFLKLPK